MALTRSFPIDEGRPNAIDLRKHDASLYPREGVLPDPVTIATAGIAYYSSAWAIAARPFGFVSKRGGAPYSQSYGSARGSNDAAMTAWTIPGAPASGTRIDRLWVRLTDPTQGEPTTTPGGETVARAVPVFGITPGTPGLATLPAGAVEIATVSTAAGAVSAAASVITQTYKFAHVVGSAIYVRNLGERDALTDVANGELSYVISEGNFYSRVTNGWTFASGPEVEAPAPSMGTASWTWGAGSRIVKVGPEVTVHALCVRNSPISGAQTIFTLPVGFRPTDAHAFVGGLVTGGAPGAIAVTVTPDGVVAIIFITTAAATAARLDFTFRVPQS